MKKNFLFTLFLCFFTPSLHAQLVEILNCTDFDLIVYAEHSNHRYVKTLRNKHSITVKACCGSIAVYPVGDKRGVFQTIELPRNVHTPGTYASNVQLISDCFGSIIAIEIKTTLDPWPLIPAY